MGALLALAACGGGDGKGTSTASASSSSTSAEPTYDDQYAYAQAKKVLPELRSHDPNKPIPASADWATANYRKTYNDAVAEQIRAGVVERGKVTIDSLHPLDSNPDAAGGWDLKMYECSTSTVRYFKDGRDVTVRPEDTSEPLPKGAHKNVHRLTFTTPDEGRTWQIDKVEQLLGDDAKEAPCAE